MLALRREELWTVEESIEDTTAEQLAQEEETSD